MYVYIYIHIEAPQLKDAALLLHVLHMTCVICICQIIMLHCLFSCSFII